MSIDYFLHSQFPAGGQKKTTKVNTPKMRPQEEKKEAAHYLKENYPERSLLISAKDKGNRAFETCYWFAWPWGDLGLVKESLFCQRISNSTPLVTDTIINQMSVNAGNQNQRWKWDIQ